MQQVADKRAARARLHELVIEDGDGKQRKSLLNAYKLRLKLLAEEKSENITTNTQTSYYSIKTMDPIIYPPEKKFDHCIGALISPLPRAKLTVKN